MTSIPFIQAYVITFNACLTYKVLMTKKNIPVLQESFGIAKTQKRFYETKKSLLGILALWIGPKWSKV